MKAAPVRPGPSSVPSAAKSLTSPAPVAPITWPGSISRRPTAKPPSAPETPTPVMRVAASATPSAPMPSVSRFGTRRVCRSTMALEAPPASTAQTLESSDILRNRLPEHVVDRRPDGSHRAQGDQRDQRHEQSVFDQVLAIVLPQQAAGSNEDAVHVVVSRTVVTVEAAIGRPLSAWQKQRQPT